MYWPQCSICSLEISPVIFHQTTELNLWNENQSRTINGSVNEFYYAIFSSLKVVMDFFVFCLFAFIFFSLVSFLALSSDPAIKPYERREKWTKTLPANEQNHTYFLFCSFNGAISIGSVQLIIDYKSFSILFYKRFLVCLSQAILHRLCEFWYNWFNVGYI